MKNQISDLGDPFPSLDKFQKLVFSGKLLPEIFTYNSINVTVCILSVLQDCFSLQLPTMELSLQQK